MARKPTSWTAALVSEVTTLWSTGKSAASIAEALGLTKGMVIGEIARLNLRDRAIDGRTFNGVRKPTLRKALPPTTTLPKAKQCKYPIGDPLLPNFHFCSKPKLPSGPYSQEHKELCYNGSGRGK